MGPRTRTKCRANHNILLRRPLRTKIEAVWKRNDLSGEAVQEEIIDGQQEDVSTRWSEIQTGGESGREGESGGKSVAEEGGGWWARPVERQLQHGK